MKKYHPSAIGLASLLLLSACSLAPNGEGGQSSQSASEQAAGYDRTMMQAQSSSQMTKIVTVKAINENSPPTVINAKKGTRLTILFSVPTNVHHDGLDFRAPTLSAGTILPGTSKSVTFTVSDDITFQSYMPASTVKKPYAIVVHAE